MGVVAVHAVVRGDHHVQSRVHHGVRSASVRVLPRSARCLREKGRGGQARRACAPLRSAPRCTLHPRRRRGPRWVGACARQHVRRARRHAARVAGRALAAPRDTTGRSAVRRPERLHAHAGAVAPQARSHGLAPLAGSVNGRGSHTAVTTDHLTRFYSVVKTLSTVTPVLFNCARSGPEDTNAVVRGLRAHEHPAHASGGRPPPRSSSPPTRPARLSRRHERSAGLRLHLHARPPPRRTPALYDDDLAAIHILDDILPSQ
jgi:hypothetical protein